MLSFGYFVFPSLQIRQCNNAQQLKHVQEEKYVEEVLNSCGVSLRYPIHEMIAFLVRVQRQAS